MTERRGRGDALRRILAAGGEATEIPGPGKNVGQEESQAGPSQSSIGVPRDEPSAPKPKARGRAAVLAAYKKAEEITEPGACAAKPELKEESTIPPEQKEGSTIPPKLKEESTIPPKLKEEQMMSKLSISKETKAEITKTPVVMKGTSGSKVNISCNYVKLFVEEGKGVFQYHVKFEPEIDALQLRRYLISREMSDIIGTIKTFDGAVLYLPHKLPEHVTEVTKHLPTDSSEVNIKITFVKQLEMGNRECIHLYNVLFKKIMDELGFILHGQNYYNPKSPVEVPAHKLQIWPGYVTSVEDFEGGVMLCCDVSHRILHTKTAHEWLDEVVYRARGNDWKICFAKSMAGQNVLTRYNNKVYRIDDVDFESTPLSKFNRRDKEISFQDYFQTQYNLKISDLRQPLLISRTKVRKDGKLEVQNVSLVPELCYLSGMTSELKENFTAMKDIASTTRVSPAQRMKTLQDFLDNVNKTPNVRKILSSWGLSLDNKCIKLDARVLPIDPVVMGNNKRARVGVDWGNDLTRNHALEVVPFESWTIICTQRDEKVTRDFLDSCSSVSSQMGLRMGRPTVVKIQRDHPQFILDAATEHKGAQFLVLILPSSRTDLYNLFKKFCNVENAIPSQVILTKTIKNPGKARSVAQKVLLQINCKLGGTLWTVITPVKHTMVVGMDTYHDPTRKNQSVGAIVGSLDKDLTHWFSKVYFQTPGTEIGNKLEIAFLSGLYLYKDRNHEFPSQIIIYRDGVSDGQLEVCKEFELSQIFTAIRAITGYDPKVLFVVVQKRINTRMLARVGQSFENPAPGTVMDHTVVKKYLFDFYLASQSVRQGTATPTHYIVIFNSTKLDADKVQRFTFLMTFLYYNWFGTIRVPAPCLYAHKLAAHVGENLGKEPNIKLVDKLFFL